MDYRKVHKNQPDGVSCGSAALATAVAILLSRKKPDWHLNNKNSLTVPMIRDMMGTNGTTGTTEKEMSCGLDCFEIQHFRHAMTDDPQAAQARMEILDKTIDNGDLCFLRGMYHGFRHWLLVCEKADKLDTFLVSDPMSGIIHLTKNQIKKLLAPRGYEIWTIPGEQTIRNLSVKISLDEKTKDIQAIVFDQNEFLQTNDLSDIPVIARHVLSKSKFNMEINRKVENKDDIYWLKLAMYAPSTRDGMNRLLSGAEAEYGVKFRITPHPGIMSKTYDYLADQDYVDSKKVIKNEYYADTHMAPPRLKHIPFRIDFPYEFGRHIIAEKLMGFEPVRIQEINTSLEAEYPSP